MPNSSLRRVDLTRKVLVRIRSIFNVGKGALLNVSSTGAYVATPMFLLPQARVKLQIVLREERRWVEAEAVVVWENRGTVERRDDLPPGYGLHFVALPKDTAALLEELLSGDGHLVSQHPEPAEPAEPAAPATVPPPAAENVDAEPDRAPYRLRGEHVKRHTPEAQGGIFVLYYDRTQEAHVGRADTDLRSTIAGFEGEYAYFYCETIENLEERYARECELFHRFGGDHAQLDSADHPTAPAGTELDCLVCVHEKVP